MVCKFTELNNAILQVLQFGCDILTHVLALLRLILNGRIWHPIRHIRMVQFSLCSLCRGVCQATCGVDTICPVFHISLEIKNAAKSCYTPIITVSHVAKCIQALFWPDTKCGAHWILRVLLSQFG